MGDRRYLLSIIIKKKKKIFNECDHIFRRFTIIIFYRYSDKSTVGEKIIIYTYPYELLLLQNYC